MIKVLFYCRFTSLSYTFGVSENSNISTIIGNVTAKDKDVSKEFSTVYYKWKNPVTVFYLNQTTGVITLNQIALENVLKLCILTK